MTLAASTIMRVRVLIPDAEAIYGEDGDDFLFSEDEIEAYYLEGFENAKCAAGLAKQAIGGSEALIMKVIKNYETSTNGASLMREWTAAGKMLYDLGLNELAAADESEGIFEVVYPEFGTNRHAEGLSHGGYATGPWGRF